MDELRRIKKLQEKYDFKTSLLIKEGCMPSCPFKTEHDDMGSTLGQGYYWNNHATVSCPTWRFSGEASDLPRIGTDLIAVDSETWEEFADLVDIFKYSGRTGSILGLIEDVENYKFVWGLLEPRSRYSHSPNVLEAEKDGTYAVMDSYKSIVENDCKPLTSWFSAMVVKKDYDNMNDTELCDKLGDKYIFTSRKGMSLNKVLKTCKNRCYDCHACEKVFGIEKFDSLIQVNRNVEELIEGANITSVKL